MTVADSFVCTVTIRFDPWGYTGDDVLEVLLPLPSDDGYQRILNLDAPKGQEFMDAHGHRRLIRLEHGQVATVTAKIETQRLALGSFLDLPPPGSADLDEGPMTVSDPALRDLARRSLAGIANPSARISALARATADALRYQYPPDARGAATSLQRGSGDCGEYAFVFVALCRAAGIPARPVFGLITAPWMATPHAWAEAWDGDGWLPVDPNFMREGGYLGPILDTGAATRNHVGALDPYRMVLSRHTGLPWPGAVPQMSSDKVEGLSLTLDGLGPVTFWHEVPHWRGKPVVPFLQMPWTVIRAPARPHFTLLRRLRPWRFSIRQPSRYLPRSLFVLADIVALHPLQCATLQPASCANCSMATFSPRKSGSIGKAMSPQNPCIEMAPFMAASRYSKEDDGSHAACDTVSGNCGKFVPGITGRLLTKRGVRDQIKAGLA